MEPMIRLATERDLAEVLALYPLAFPDEDLTQLVSALSADASVIGFVATRNGQVVGHALFSGCGTVPRDLAGVLVGPLAVLSKAQRNGVGTAVLRAGLEHLTASGVRQAFVLGDPSYYRRVGFRAERDVIPPYPLPDEWAHAWQSLALSLPPLTPGKLILPEPWQNPALWSA